jgi:hypothetical protein
VFHSWLLILHRSANQISHSEKFDNPLSLNDVAQPSASKRPAGTKGISQGKTTPAVGCPCSPRHRGARPRQIPGNRIKDGEQPPVVGLGVLTAKRLIHLDPPY